MFNRLTKKAKSPTQYAGIINTLAKNVAELRNMRPVTTSYGYVDLPWGQATVPGNADWMIAYTDSGGIPKATRDGDGVLTLGMGGAFEAYPTYNDSTGVVTIDYRANVGFPLTVYNLAANSDGAVEGGRWIIMQRFWKLWVVTWEECPD
jgi:hypothetical protein